MLKFNRRKILKITPVIIIVVAIGVGWGLTLFSGQVDMRDPVAVAEQFTSDLQSNYPHAAFALTTSTYHKNTKESDFTSGIATDITKQMPMTKIQFFSKATPPPSDKKDSGQARVVLNIPKDSQTDDHTMTIMLLQEHGQWYVQVFTLSLGLAHR